MVFGHPMAIDLRERERGNSNLFNSKRALKTRINVSPSLGKNGRDLGQRPQAPLSYRLRHPAKALQGLFYPLRPESGIETDAVTKLVSRCENWAGGNADLGAPENMLKWKRLIADVAGMLYDVLFGEIKIND